MAVVAIPTDDKQTSRRERSLQVMTLSSDPRPVNTLNVGCITITKLTTIANAGITTQIRQNASTNYKRGPIFNDHFPGATPCDLSSCLGYKWIAVD